MDVHFVLSILIIFVWYFTRSLQGSRCGRTHTGCTVQMRVSHSPLILIWAVQWIQWVALLQMATMCQHESTPALRVHTGPGDSGKITLPGPYYRDRLGGTRKKWLHAVTGWAGGDAAGPGVKVSESETGWGLGQRPGPDTVTILPVSRCPGLQ
jgi:hypothetical protein